MTYIHDNEVNNIAKCNLLHDIINPPKRARNINIHYSPILHGFMNTRKGRSKFKNILIILDGGCSYTIVMRRQVNQLSPENRLLCSGKHRTETSLLILRFKYILPYLHLARQMS